MGYVRFAILELRNQVTIPSYTNDVILRVTNLKFEKKKFRFELLARRLNFYFFTFELVTRSRKIKSYVSSY